MQLHHPSDLIQELNSNKRATSLVLSLARTSGDSEIEDHLPMQVMDDDMSVVL